MKKQVTQREPARVRQVTPLGGFRVELVFADGHVKIVNLKRYLHGPAFERARSDPAYFRKVFVDPIGETIMWPNTADIDADVLRYDLTPSWMEKPEARKRTRSNGDATDKPEPVVATKVYLYPRQIKFLGSIDSNLSAAIRKVVDSYQE